MANFKIPNVPPNLTMQDFRGVSNKFGGLAKGCKFLAKIDAVGPKLVSLTNGTALLSDLVYLCETTEFPGRQFHNVDLRYYGPTFKLPYQTAYEDLNMTFLTRNESVERQFFDDWMEIIHPTRTFDFEYRDNYKANISLYQISDIEGKGASYAFTLLDAFPTLVNPQQVTWADDQFLRLGITFTYNWWYRRGRDDIDSSASS